MSENVAEPPDVETPPVTPEGETNRFEDFLDNLEETDAPPQEVPPQRGRKAKIPREAKPKKPLPRWKDGAVSAYAEKIYKAAGAAALLNHDPEIRHIGQQMIECAFQCGEAWEKVAKRNELVRRFFDRIMTTSDMGELFWSHVPILIPLLRKFGPFRANFAHIQEDFERAYEEAA